MVEVTKIIIREMLKELLKEETAGALIEKDM